MTKKTVYEYIDDHWRIRSKPMDQQIEYFIDYYTYEMNNLLETASRDIPKKSLPDFYDELKKIGVSVESNHQELYENYVTDLAEKHDQEIERIRETENNG